MSLLQKAEALAAKKQSSASALLLAKAFQKEKEAAFRLKERDDAEPTRSVLFRGAAALAMRCREFAEAERLAAHGLSGFPRPEIRQELVDIVERVNLERHFELRGVTLTDDDVQMSVTGEGAFPGFARVEEVTTRIHATKNALLRTAERTRRIDFKEQGDRALREPLQVGIGSPRDQSFAVSMRLVAPSQHDLLGGLQSVGVLEEFVDCLDVFASNDERALRARISDPNYYNNFLGIARQLSPDGVSITAVGFTATVKGTTKTAALTTPRSEITFAIIDRPPAQAQAPLPDEKPEKVRLLGIVKMADSTKDKDSVITLVQQKGRKKEKLMIHVPLGLMKDTVQSHYEEEVTVVATRRGDQYTLDDVIQHQTSLFDLLRGR